MPNLLSVQVESAKITRLKDKFARFGPYATKEGLKGASSYLNSIKGEMYPASRNGSPFVWSSERQRRYVFANIDLPYNRTMQLANSGRFEVDENYYMVGYTNSMPAWIFILHPQYQIIGHRTRGWPTINRWTVRQSSRVVSHFKTSVLSAWERMDSEIFGGAPGL